MIEQLIGKVFAARDSAHLAHWRTSSRSDHQALGDFYEKAVSVLDRIVECHQGAFEKIKAVKPEPVEQDALKMLSEQVVWIGENIVALSQGLPPIENMLAELMELYLSTIFQLNNLR